MPLGYLERRSLPGRLFLVSGRNRSASLDPGSVAAQGRAAAALAARVIEGVTDSAAADIERAQVLTEQALTAAPHSWLAHFAKGQVLRAQNRFEEAILEYETVLAINRSSVFALYVLSECKLYAGSIEELDPACRAGPPARPSRPAARSLVCPNRTGASAAVAHAGSDRMAGKSARRHARSSEHARQPRLGLCPQRRDRRAAAELAEARNLNRDERFSSIARLKAARSFGVPKIRALFETTYIKGLRMAGMAEECAPSPLAGRGASTPSLARAQLRLRRRLGGDRGLSQHQIRHPGRSV